VEEFLVCLGVRETIMAAKWPPPIMHMKICGSLYASGKGIPVLESTGILICGFGESCFFCMISCNEPSFSCSSFVKIARYTPRYVFFGKVGVANHISGGFPDPLFCFRDPRSSTSSLLFDEMAACFLSNELSVVSLRLPSSSSSESSESEPERLSSRSK
jgi:hypothetical protein